MRFVLGIGTFCLLFLPRLAETQTCAEPHYRWSEKTDTSLRSLPATEVDVTDVLGWAPRSLTKLDKCAARMGRELQVYSVTGWIRRIRLHELDGDWHIELTEEETSPVTSCIVVEIPAPSYGVLYGQARADLKTLVDTTALSTRGDLALPVQVLVTGAAFFDGYHQKKPAGGGAARASQHGRCNSSVRALWEIHPIYKVQAPESP